MTVEFDYSGTPLADRGTTQEVHALTGRPSEYKGVQGVVEAIWLVEGEPPWDGGHRPRPLYRVRWRQRA